MTGEEAAMHVIPESDDFRAGTGGRGAACLPCAVSASA